MIRVGILCLTLLIGAAGCSTSKSNDPAAPEVKKLAEELAAATMKGDYARVIDFTYDKAINVLGGKEAALKAAEQAMGEVKAKGFAFKSYTVGDPEEFVTEGDMTFTVVPSVGEMTMPGGRVKMKGYLLGISSDGKKSWKFLDGAELHNPAFREQVLPKLPSKLKLPAQAKPEIIKN